MYFLNKANPSFPPPPRDSGNDFDLFSLQFLEGRILDIQAACKNPIRNANFKSCFSEIRLNQVLFPICRISTQSEATDGKRTKIERKWTGSNAMSGKWKSFPLSAPTPLFLSTTVGNTFKSELQIWPPIKPDWPRISRCKPVTSWEIKLCQELKLPTYFHERLILMYRKKHPSRG